MDKIIGILGLAVLLGIAFAVSKHRDRISLRAVGGAFAIQLTLGAFVLLVPFGQDILASISNGVSWALSFAKNGAEMVFGPLATFKVGFIFITNVLMFIIFFASLISLLYHLGIMQVVIRIIGGGLHKALGTSRAESMSAAANIFVGQTEAPLVIKPYINDMTESEFFAVCAGGLASIAGSGLAGYAAMGVPVSYLLAASFMAAPGGLLYAKLIFPETGTPNNKIELSSKSAHANAIHAAAEGASEGVQLVINIAAMLVAFVALIALINGSLSAIGNLFSYPQLSLDLIFGYLFAPIAWVMGVPSNEVLVAGTIIGTKTAINEFVAYAELVKHFATYAMTAADGTKKVIVESVYESLPAVEQAKYHLDHAATLTKKTQVILSFALCGFANFSSIAILIGGIGALAPQRRHELASIGMYAVLAGTLSNFTSATIAGLFF